MLTCSIDSVPVCVCMCLCVFSRKMLKHGRAGVPLEVMGLMLGDFVDEFTVRVIGELQYDQATGHEFSSVQTS